MASIKYTVKDSFAFAEEIFEQDSDFFMGSLDVNSLFTNIPLEKTTVRVEGTSKIEYKELLYLAAKVSYFIFNGKLYKQVDGIVKGSLLGPTLANASLVCFEKNWLQNYLSDFKPRYYRRHVDGIFVLFTLPEN